MGSVYRPKYRDKEGNLKESNVWWIKYYKDGKPYRESARTTKKGKAEKKLKAREGEVVEGRFHGIQVEKVTFDELAEDLLNDYRVNGRKSLDRAELSIRALKGSFEGMRISDITTDRINVFVLRRRNEGAKNSTINRDLSALKRMFNLGARTNPPKVLRIPHIPMLKESAPRSGFFTHEEYKALKTALPSHLKPVVTLAYHTGMRIGEIRNLTWAQVDFFENKITLNPGTTKNSEGRIIYMAGELLETISFQKTLRDANCPECPWVFFEKSGKAIGRLDTAWKTACKRVWEKSESKIRLWDPEKERPTRTFHDFRRTGVRNLVRAGVPERVAMMISGHKTRSVFERYNIVDERDLKKASKKVAEYHLEQAKNSDGQSLGKVTPNTDIFEEAEQEKSPVTH